MQIAVVGIGCRFPGDITDANSLWQFLLDGRCAITDIPDDRWNADAFYSPHADATGWSRSKWGGFLNRVFDFDHEFFDISPAEARHLDPQQRLLLQIAYEAIQDAGHTLASMSAATTGVFVGISNSDFANVLRFRNRNDDLWGGSGCAFSIAANRISHRLNLTGPSFSIDTACSSALMAIDQACRNLASGMCDRAIAGGVNCLFEPSQFISFSNASMLSRTGRISTFDAAANGYVRSEGCGLVILRPLDDAVRDGDRIYAVVSATATNQDGWTSTLMAPNMRSQEKMLRSLVDKAGMAPGEVDYVEAHGTGTPTGDPIEAHAVGHAFGRVDRREPVVIGSMKPNLGHMEPAAGAAGFIKSVLTVHNGIAAPNIHFETPNPAIPFEALNITVPSGPTALETGGRPRNVVVNSFGWGGANASALLSSYEPKPVRRSRPRKAAANGGARAVPVVVPLSAHSPEALVRWSEHLADTIEANPGQYASTTDLAHALAVNRDHFAERAAVICDDSTAGLIEKLRDAAEQIEAGDGGSGPGDVIRGHAAKRHRVVFCFSGQGAQWWAMGRELLHTSDVFSNAIDEFDKHFKRLSGWKVRDALQASEKESRVGEGEIAQPTLIALQIALARYWGELGIKPDAVLGHSLGEVSAAHVAGALSVAEVARVMHIRSRIQHQAPEPGAMAVVGLPADQIRRFLEPHPSVVISAFNNSTTVTISGRAEPLDQILADLAAHDPNLFVRRLRTDFAWHSELLDYGEKWFRKELRRVRWRRPTIPFVSTVTGLPHEEFDLDYWWHNLREPVAYERAAGWCLAQDFDVFVEIGPDRTVSPLNMAIAQEAGKKIVNVNSLERNRSDQEVLRTAIGRLYVNGVSVDWSGVLGRTGRAESRLPAHPWANETIRFLPREAEYALFQDMAHPLLGRRIYGPTLTWFSEIDTKYLPYLKDHRVIGDAVFPAAAFVEMMIAAVQDASDRPGPVELSSVQFLEALSLKANSSIAVTTHYDPPTGKIEIYARSRENDEDWTLRAEGYGWRRDVAIDAFEVDARTGDKFDAEIGQSDFYVLTDHHGLNYGPAFRGVRRVRILDDSASEADLELPEAASEDADRYYLHPATFDSLLQSSLALNDKNAGLWHMNGSGAEIAESDERFALKLPVSIDRLLWKAPLPQTFRSRVDGGRRQAGIYTAFDDDGAPILRVEALNVRTVQLSHAAAGDAQPVPRFFAEQFLPVDAPADGSRKASMEDETWLVVASRGGAVKGIVKSLKATGTSVVTCEPDEVGVAVDEWIAAGAASDPDPRALCVLYAGALDLAVSGDVVETAEAVAVQFIEVARQLSSVATSGRSVRLVALTNHARTPVAGEPLPGSGLSQRVLMGAMRTAANEMPAIRLCSIDLDDAALADVARMRRLIIDPGDETEWIVRGSEHFVPRLQEVGLENLHSRADVVSGKDKNRNYSVSISKPGSFDNISLRVEDMPPCGPDEVVIETAAVGLNFRDVMAATGVLPGEPEDDTAWWRNLGGEASGTVVEVGADVTTVAPGDRVISVGKGAMRRYAAVHERQVVRIPDQVNLSDAAAVPIAYLTAVYCLEHLGRLRKGERVLIHLGTGGVGLAAIQVAKHVGAEIFATAGNDRKRQYLRDLGITHVMDSRDLQFGDQILSVTDGRGVDVVLNSLAGPAIDVGLSCLAPFGRFVEIGKRDVEDDKPIGLRALLENKSYAVVDLSVLHLEQPDIARDILTRTFEHIGEGHYAMLPTTRYPVAKTPDAMRLMSRAEHIGKVVLDFGDTEVAVHQNITADPSFRADRSYVVTGGTNGFGLVLADWLSRYGAGCVHLVSRSGKLAADGELLARSMRGRGTRIEIGALDVTDHDDVVRFLKRQQAGSHPVAGIFHAAAVLDDGLLAQLEPERVLRVMRPKVAGAWNLHTASIEAGCDLDQFVMFSSIAEVLGSAGQANYAAANAFFGGLAESRQASGLVANTISLGALSDTGMVARSDALAGYLDSLGIKPMSNADVIEAFSRLMRIDDPILTYAAVDWQALGRATPNTATVPRVGALVAASSAKHSLLRSELATTPRDRWQDLIAKSVFDEITKVLKIEGRQLPFDQPFAEIGIDSLSAFELKNRIESLADVSLPASRFLQAPTINSVSEVIAEAIEESEKSSAEDVVAGDGSGDADHGDDNRAIPLVAGQRRWLELASGAGDEDTLVPGPVRSVRVVLPARVGEAQVRQALQRVAANHAAVHLRVDAAGIQRFVPDGPVALERVDEDAPVPSAFTVDEAMWRFVVSPAEGGRLALRVSAHAIAADTASVAAIAHEILALVSGRKAPRAAARDWPEIARSRNVESGTAEYFRGQTYWREMLAWAKRLHLPKSSTLGYIPELADRRGRPLGVLRVELSDRIVPAAKPRDEEVAAIAAFTQALREVSGSTDFAIERWSAGRDGAAVGAIVGPLARTVPVVVDHVRVARDGDIAAIRRMIDEAAAIPAFDTATIEDVLGDELADVGSLLRQCGFAYLNLTGLTGDQGQALRDTIGIELCNDIRLNAVRDAGGMTFELVFDTERVAEADVRAVGEAFGSAYSKLAEVTRARRRQIAEAAWRRDGDTETRLSEQFDAIWPTDTEADKRHAGWPGVSRAADGTLPLSMQQSFLLTALRDDRTTDDFRRFWWISRAFHIQPSIEVDRLREAASKMAAMHESMRTRFVERDGQLRALIEPRLEPNIEVRDLGPMDDSEIIQHIEELDHDTQDPLTELPYSIVLLRCGKRGDVLYVRVHHSIMDGWSMSLAVEQMLLLYLGQSLPKPQFSFIDYLRDYDRSHEPAALAEREAYFQELLTDPPSVPWFGPRRRGTSPNLDLIRAGRAHELVFTLAESQKREIYERAKLSAVSPTALLVGAMAQSINEVSKSRDDVLVCVPVAMRQDARLRDFVGWVATITPVRCEVSGHRSLDRLAQQIYSQYQTSILHLPADFTVRRGQLHREMGAAGSYMTLFEAGMLTADGTSGGASIQTLTRAAAHGTVKLAGYEVRPIGSDRVRAGCAYHVDIRSFEGPNGHSYRCCYDSDVVAPASAMNLFCEVLTRLGVGDASLSNIRSTGGLVMDPAAE